MMLDGKVVVLGHARSHDMEKIFGAASYLIDKVMELCPPIQGPSLMRKTVTTHAGSVV